MKTVTTKGQGLVGNGDWTTIRSLIYEGTADDRARHEYSGVFGSRKFALAGGCFSMCAAGGGGVPAGHAFMNFGGNYVS